MRPALTPRATHTWADFVELDEDDPRELVDGELVEIEVPGFDHEHAVTRLVYLLSAWCEPRAAGRVLVSGYKIRVDDERGAMPDVQVYLRGNTARFENKGLTVGRPDLAVEVISPTSGRFDRVHKLHWYAALGIPEYWLVDPQDRTIQRLVLQGEHYLVSDSLVGDETFRPSSFEGLEISLRSLWEPPPL